MIMLKIFHVVGWVGAALFAFLAGIDIALGLWVDFMLDAVIVCIYTAIIHTARRQLRLMREHEARMQQHTKQ